MLPRRHPRARLPHSRASRHHLRRAAPRSQWRHLGAPARTRIPPAFTPPQQPGRYGARTPQPHPQSRRAPTVPLSARGAAGQPRGGRALTAALLRTTGLRKRQIRASAPAATRSRASRALNLCRGGTCRGIRCRASFLTTRRGRSRLLSQRGWRRRRRMSSSAPHDRAIVRHPLPPHPDRVRSTLYYKLTAVSYDGSWWVPATVLPPHVAAPHGGR
jgi:hypothetical protein